MGLIDDVVKSGGNLDRLLNTFSKKFKKLQQDSTRCIHS